MNRNRSNICQHWQNWQNQLNLFKNIIGTTSVRIQCVHGRKIHPVILNLKYINKDFKVLCAGRTDFLWGENYLMINKKPVLAKKATRNTQSVERSTALERHFTLVEQDARVSANFTQKRQEKNCNTFVGKKGMLSDYKIFLNAHWQGKREMKMHQHPIWTCRLCRVSKINIYVVKRLRKLERVWMAKGEAKMTVLLNQ